MSVRARLNDLGVELCSDIMNISCSVSEPSVRTSSASHLPAQENPLVSCLMMTRGNLELMRHSLASYRRQTYRNRELVIVTEPEAGERVRAFIASQEILNVRIFVAPSHLTLGDHRNLGSARANGSIIVIWDDDDLSDPARIDMAVRVLRQTGAAASFLSRVLVWWPYRRVAAVSTRRVWENTMAVWRDHLPIYPALARGSDTPAIERLINTTRIALVDCPFAYVYAATGENTWKAPHFEWWLRGAEIVIEGEQFDELNELLSSRLPVLEYATHLKAHGAFRNP
jgi:hypothetical protein